MTEYLPDTNVGNIEYIRKQDAIDVAREDGKKIPTVAIRIMHDIKALPAADVVPVVRCKDCIKCIHDSLFGQLWCNMTLVTRRVKPDDFCSYGKLKDGLK